MLRVMKKQKTIHQLPNTNIVIDYWKSLEREDDRSIRFMTVFRIQNDQLQFMKKSKYKIYTSSNNKKLLEFHEIPADRIIEIEPGICIEIIDKHAKYSFKVSTIESNYCAGSCMFLFQGPFGNVLYTGFFRPAISSDPLTDHVLKNLIRDKRVDEVYIDNSYAAEHCQFPSRADVIRDAIDLIKEHPEHRIIIAGNKFGKEEILRDITISLDEHIGVSKSKHEELSFMMTQQSLKRFSLDQDECRIIVEDELLSLNQCKKKQLEKGLCLIILLTAQYVCKEMCCGVPAPQLSNLCILPYSSHASHSELMEFLYYLKARKIMPIILTESENTIIPKKMMEMCYTDEDSAPLQDSNFYFETLTHTLAFKNECETVPETTNSHYNGRNATESDHNDAPMERLYNNNCSHDPMDLDVPLNTTLDEEEIDYVDSNMYHESKSVASIGVLEAQNKILCNENSNAEYMVDPLSINESYDVSPVCDFVEPRLNFDRIESVARSPALKCEDDNIMTSPVSGSDETILHTFSSDPALLHNDNKRIDASAISNSENDQPQTLRDEEMSCDEIPSSIGSVGLCIYSEALCYKNDPSEMEVNGSSNQSLSIFVESENFSSRLLEECTSDEDEKLGAVLHHVWLVTTTEDWQGTNLTKDSWEFL